MDICEMTRTGLLGNKGVFEVMLDDRQIFRLCRYAH